MDVSSVVKRLRMNQKTQDSSFHVRTAPNRVMLPANWKELDNPRALVDKIREVNFDKDVSSSLIEKIRTCEKDQNVSTHVETADDRVMLPANWKELSSSGALIDKIREGSECKYPCRNC